MIAGAVYVRFSIFCYEMPLSCLQLLQWLNEMGAHFGKHLNVKQKINIFDINSNANFCNFVCIGNKFMAVANIFQRKHFGFVAKHIVCKPYGWCRPKEVVPNLITTITKTGSNE